MFACSLTALLCFFLSQSCHLWFFFLLCFQLLHENHKHIIRGFLDGGLSLSLSSVFSSYFSQSPSLFVSLCRFLFHCVWQSAVMTQRPLICLFRDLRGIILHVCVCESISILWNTCGCLCMCDTQRVCFLSHQSPCCSVSWTSSFSHCALLNHCAWESSSWALMKFTVSFSISCLSAGAVGFHEIFRLEISIGLGKSFNSTLICQIASRGRQVVDF